MPASKPTTDGPATLAGVTASSDQEYRDLLEQGQHLLPGVRVGRPGRSRTYWAMIAAMRLLRLRYRVVVAGREHVGPGAAILVGNHTSYVDPVAVVMGNWWRVVAFTKAEAFEGRGSIFFRIMGQIPLRRGDEQATHWAMEMSRHVLADGSKIGIYPEGTRAPDRVNLHKLHKRVLIPLLRENPDTPVHAVVTTYHPKARRRTLVRVQISEPLVLDARTMTPDELAAVLTEALISTGGLGYVDRYARDVKADLAAGVTAG